MKTAAESKIRREIQKEGKISFVRFMELALYHSHEGYYTSPSPFGEKGDYYTSPAAHPAFGALLCVQLQRMWELLGKPSPFHIIEPGAGTGILARDIVEYSRHFSDAFADSLRYITLDRYESSHDLLQGFSNVERIVSSSIPFGDITGCVISNELVDSFPVHRFVVEHGAVKEIYVTLNEDGGFGEVTGTPSTDRLSQRIAELGVELGEGFRGEVNLNIRSWIQQASKALRKGFVVTIDYGYEAAQLYAPERRIGTLQTYYRHTEGGSPYQRVGRQDITAHVDFSLVASEGLRAGLRPVTLMTQETFLKSNGFDEMLASLRNQGLGQQELRANMMAMLELVNPDSMGRFKVMIQERNTEISRADDLMVNQKLRKTLKTPLLSENHMALIQGNYPEQIFEVEHLWPFR